MDMMSMVYILAVQYVGEKVDDVLTERVIWQVDAWDARAAKVGSLWQF
jgi:hypothetical protein